MAAETALKQELDVVPDVPKEYNKELYERFIFWRDTSGSSQNRVATMLGRSAAAVSQYIHKKFEGDLEKFEKDVESLLRREEDLQIPFKDPDFVLTSAAREIWTILQICDESHDAGIVIGPAGIGKTKVLNEYKRQNRGTILVTADITIKRVGAILWLISKKLGIVSCRSNAVLLNRIADTLKGSRRLLIVDETQFLTWEAFEAVRKIYDCAGIGVVYCGMQRLYSQMRGGNKAYLFDQIFSRIGPRVHVKTIRKEDVKLIVDNIYPGLDAQCLGYLFKKATQPGKFRLMVKLLKLADQMSRAEDIPLTVSMLKEANKLLNFWQSEE